MVMALRAAVCLVLSLAVEASALRASGLSARPTLPGHRLAAARPLKAPYYALAGLSSRLASERARAHVYCSAAASAGAESTRAHVYCSAASDAGAAGANEGAAGWDDAFRRRRLGVFAFTVLAYSAYYLVREATSPL